MHVKLTYWPDFDKYRSPRGPRYDWNWEVDVSVIPDGGHFTVNEVLYSQVKMPNSDFPSCSATGAITENGSGIQNSWRNRPRVHVRDDEAR